MYKFSKQTPKDASWQDESGTSIPYNRTTKAERLREAKAFQLANKATALYEDLKAFKAVMQQTCDDVVAAIREEHKVKTDTKGNFTWYNFNQSIKVEVNVNDMIKFDETLIDAAKEKLMAIIDRNLTGDDFIKSIVAEAFQTSTGKLDTKRILGLKKHTARIKDMFIKTEWEAAMSLIDSSISRPESRAYFRIWIKDDSGDYQNIDLNFSSIKA